jgi:uncharacterized membrane protein YkoI
MKRIIVLLCSILISAGMANAQCGFRAKEVETRQKSSLLIPKDTTETGLKKLATVSKKEAAKIATSKYPGKVKIAELAIDEGTLVWKLEVKGNEGQKEIFIDPSSGTFLGYGLTK